MFDWPQAPLLERLQRRSDLSSNGGGCWKWLGTLNENGYGKISISNNGNVRRFFVHRAAFALFHPSWDGSGCVLHRCDVRCCWNPDHLFLGTIADNVADMVAKGRARNGDVRGERNPSARITWEIVRSIRRDFISGDARKVIAERYRMRQRNVDQIIRGDLWKEESWVGIRLPRGGNRDRQNIDSRRLDL